MVRTCHSDPCLQHLCFKKNPNKQQQKKPIPKPKSWTLEGIPTIPSDSVREECLILDEVFGAQVPSGESWHCPEAVL